MYVREACGPYDARRHSVDDKEVTMANRKTRLELTWIDKENRPKLEPRVLIEDPDNSYHCVTSCSKQGPTATKTHNL